MSFPLPGSKRLRGFLNTERDERKGGWIRQNHYYGEERYTEALNIAAH